MFDYGFDTQHIGEMTLKALIFQVPERKCIFLIRDFSKILENKRKNYEFTEYDELEVIA